MGGFQIPAWKKWTKFEKFDYNLPKNSDFKLGAENVGVKSLLYKQVQSGTAC